MASNLVEPLPLPAEPGVALLRLHRRHPARYPVLLESSASGTAQGRYTMLLARPGRRLVCDAAGPPDRDGPTRGFLERLDDWWRREARPGVTGRWPFEGGWFVMLGYELAGEIEPTLHLPDPPSGEGSLAWRMRAAVVHDHATGETVAIAEQPAHDFAGEVRGDLAGASSEEPISTGGARVEEERGEAFIAMVERVKAHIAAGDVYQANISRAWRARLGPGTVAADVYARLRRANPGPFAGIAALGATTIVSSSPERLVRVLGRRIETRPIAGTMPRQAGADAGAIAELIRNPKERAEHVMLIDLERNDLGRLCEPGSVRVDELMQVESYAHVHHIVSNVVGRLRPGVTPGEVIRATFPGGTITGCPKVRCMQLIGELEGEGRGAYTGSMGYLCLDGNLDLNILIRTLTLRRGRATLRTGAGIVADSDPVRELEETRAKARGVLAALREPS
jgi:anthranilate synthase component 1